MCKRIFAHQTSEFGEVPFYKIGTIGTVPDAYISQSLFNEYKHKYNFPKKGEVMITCAGTVGKAIQFDGKDAYFQDSNIVWVSNSQSSISNDFLFYALNRINWNKLNSTTITRIYNDDLRNTVVSIPKSKAEQSKIVSLMQLIDRRIATQRKIIEELESLIETVSSRLFQKVIQENGLNSSVGDVLMYEQPSKYLVNSPEYTNNVYDTPVLTANKTFILGYTTENSGIYAKGDCILLDDFTLDTKYVDFPFKVKSSAVKILTSSSQTLLQYAYEYLHFLRLASTEHKRHYISMIEPMQISVPPNETIENIVRTLRSLRKKQNIEQKIMSLMNEKRRYLLSKMFI